MPIFSVQASHTYLTWERRPVQQCGGGCRCGADGQGRGGCRLHPMDAGSAALWCGWGRLRCRCNALQAGVCASPTTGSCCWRLRGALLQPHLEPKVRARPIYVLVDTPEGPRWHARAACVRSRTPRVRAPMAVTRAFGHPRVSMELATVALSWPQAGVLASANVGGQWGSTPHGASRREHRLRALVNVHGALPALNARLPCPRMRHVHILTDVCVSRTRVGGTCHGRRRRRYCRRAWASL